MRNSLATLLFAALSVLVASRCAYGDGCMMLPREVGSSSQIVASSPRQEALLATDGRTMQVVLQTWFDRGPAELAWVVPVPQKPENIRQGPEDMFRGLASITTPEFYELRRRSGWGLSCGCAAGAGEAALSSPTGAVKVEETGTAGMLEYAVLSGRDAGKLVDWLNDHRYRVPTGAQAVFDRYARDGWHWLAMRLKPDAGDWATAAPQPITYTYRDSRLVYPMAISSLSAAPHNEILLYVVSDRRYGCGNWANATINEGDLRLDPASNDGTNYAAVFEHATRADGGHAFVTEMFSNWSLFGYEDGRNAHFNAVLDRGLLDNLGNGQCITRLRAVIGPAQMDRDVELRPSASQDKVSNRFHLAAVTAESPTLAAVTPLLAFGALCAGVSLRRRRGWPRGAGIGCILLACAAFAMM
ncbi:MAG: hypothetical protein BIFFINMI_04225 [Phycisphaerae bacterium]|nr:hypothetical protein [Phycisphaerae bacterium]